MVEALVAKKTQFQSNIVKKNCQIFVNNIFEKIQHGKIDIEDGSHYFKLKEHTSKSEVDESDDEISYDAKISPEMKYLIYELYKTINENLSQSHNSYKIYCMLTELIFEDVGEVLDKFNKNLIAYINNEEKDIKWLKDKIENVHRVNIKNIVKVFRGYIIPGENAFNEAEADREDLIRAIIKELNIEISRESQSHIENVFMKLFGEGKVHRPDFS